MTFNATSIRSKARRDIIETVSEIEDFDLLIITETWLTEDFADGMISFSRYNLAVRSDRFKTSSCNKPPGGGVAILIKKGIKYHSPKSVNINNYAEVAAIKIKELRIVGVYRKPGDNASFDTRLKDYIVSNFNEDNILIGGDLNLPGVCWDTEVYPSRPARLWGEIIREMSLSQLVRGATYRSSGNQLDCFLTRSKSNVCASLPIISNCFGTLSVHDAVIIDVNVVFCKQVICKEVFNYKEADWASFKDLTGSCSSESVFKDGVNNTEGWDIIINTFISARDKSCPKVQISEGGGPKWFSPKLKAMIQKCRRLKSKCNKLANAAVSRERNKNYRSLRNNISNQIKCSRFRFEAQRVMAYTGNPNSLFATIKKAKSSNMVSPPINDPSGRPLITDLEKAEAFQTKFSSVFTPRIDTIIDWSPSWGLNTINFTTSKVNKAIKAMKRSAAPGEDQIGPIFYKEANQTLVGALATLYQNIMSTCDIPPAFYQSKVIPLWKSKGSISDIDTFRQISLGCTGIKVMESVILTDINDHLEFHDLIDPWQHGFQKKKSTVTNLLTSWEFISKQMDEHESWVSLSLDFSCAFDKASTYHILMSLKNRGISGDLGRFLEKWLKGRTQYVAVGEQRSSIQPCTSGVAQGSIGGPQFFCCLLSDVFSTVPTDGAEISAKLFAFADDSRILFQMKNPAQAAAAQCFLDSLQEKITEVGLSLNAGKSVIVYYGNHNYHSDLKIQGVLIPVKDQSLELGCVMSNNLSFKPQIERNFSKASKFVFIIRNTLKVRNYSTLKKLYQVYFCPILLYACVIWVSDYVYAKDFLHRAFRLFWRLGNNKILPGNEIMDPFQLAIKQCLTFLFQMKNGLTCLKFEDFFELKDRTTTRSELNADLYIQKNNLTSRNAFFTTYIAKWYNLLPLDIKESSSVQVFKSRVADFIKLKEPTPPMSFLPWYER